MVEGQGLSSAEALEKRQLRILESIGNLELLLSRGKKLESSGDRSVSVTGGFGLDNGDVYRVTKETCDSETVEQRLSKILQAAGATEFIFRTVPSDYYERTYEERRDLLGAASVDHLCKTIVMVNTQAHESVKDCSDRKNSKYYVVVVQYTARLNAEKIKAFVHSLNEGKIPKKRFNLRLAPEEESNKLTGFEHNAVTPIGMREDIPVILSDAIVKLSPRFFWLGGDVITGSIFTSGYAFCSSRNLVTDLVTRPGCIRFSGRYVGMFHIFSLPREATPKSVIGLKVEIM